MRPHQLTAECRRHPGVEPRPVRRACSLASKRQRDSHRESSVVGQLTGGRFPRALESRCMATVEIREPCPAVAAASPTNERLRAALAGRISWSDGHRTALKARAPATSPATLRALPIRALRPGRARAHRRGRSRAARPWAPERRGRHRPLPHPPVGRQEPPLGPGDRGASRRPRRCDV